MARRFYWLKLKRDFFKQNEIQIIESMPNGKDYILFYLKLLCESIDHDGNLRFNDEIPYNEQMLATITRTNVDVVRSAIKIFADLRMMEIMDDGTYYMKEVEKMIGSESASAQRVRAYRERKRLEEGPKALQCNADVTNSNIEIEKEIEIETEIEGEIETEEREPEAPAPAPAAAPPVPYEEIRGLYHGICSSYPRVVSMSTNRKKAIAARWKEYDCDLEIFRELFEKAEESAFMKGKNDRNWRADFDWMLKSDNMAKILEGKYDGQRRTAGGSDSGSVSTMDVLAQIAAEEAAAPEAAYTAAE